MVFRKEKEMKNHNTSRKSIYVLVGIGLLITLPNRLLNAQSIELVIVGQSLIKMHPEKHWSNPFATVRPILESADIGFTNFEMAVDDNCDVPEGYNALLGFPELGEDIRPGNTDDPHAVDENIMEFLFSLNLKLMSLTNNHAWDLGDCGIKGTIAAAEKYGVTHAGTGENLKEATEATIINVKGVKIALVAATTSRDERDIILATESSPGVNGVWTGWQEDWDRNIEAVRQARQKADFIIYYQHFQIDQEDADGRGDDGHKEAGDMFEWQEKFAKAVIDAGAGIFIAHGSGYSGDFGQ